MSRFTTLNHESWQRVVLVLLNTILLGLSLGTIGLRLGLLGPPDTRSLPEVFLYVQQAGQVVGSAAVLVALSPLTMTEDGRKKLALMGFAVAFAGQVITLGLLAMSVFGLSHPIPSPIGSLFSVTYVLGSAVCLVAPMSSKATKADRSQPS
jgi:hypothetical protein